MANLNDGFNPGLFVHNDATTATAMAEFHTGILGTGNIRISWIDARHLMKTGRDSLERKLFAKVVDWFDKARNDIANVTKKYPNAGRVYWYCSELERELVTASSYQQFLSHIRKFFRAAKFYNDLSGGEMETNIFVLYRDNYSI